MHVLVQRFIKTSSVAGLFVIAISMITVTSGCDQESHKGLAAYPEIRKIFSAEEIQDLTTILDFFEDEICDMQNVPRGEVDSCYAVFLKNINLTTGNGLLYVPIAFDKQLQMYKQLHPSAFTDIWLMGKGVNSETGDTIRRMNLSFDGKYAQFLDSLTNDHKIVTAYANALRQDQRLSSRMIDAVLYASHQYDLTDPRMRLFLAMHYLTINDMYERKNHE